MGARVIAACSTQEKLDLCSRTARTVESFTPRGPFDKDGKKTPQ